MDLLLDHLLHPLYYGHQNYIQQVIRDYMEQYMVGLFILVRPFSLKIAAEVLKEFKIIGVLYFDQQIERGLLDEIPEYVLEKIEKDLEYIRLRIFHKYHLDPFDIRFRIEISKEPIITNYAYKPYVLLGTGIIVTTLGIIISSALY